MRYSDYVEPEMAVEKTLNTLMDHKTVQVLQVGAMMNESSAHARIDVSPHKIYQWKVKGGVCEEAKGCRRHATFHYHHESECQVGLYCTKLGGNICGDSELRVVYGPEQVCWPLTQFVSLPFVKTNMMNSGLFV